MPKFNHITFNGEAFGAYMERVPKLTHNEIIKSGVFKGNTEIRKAFSNQTGTGYAILPYYGNIGGEALNYDGKTNIDAKKVLTSEQGVVVVGRANAWVEDDFAEDITGGVDFMKNVAMQVTEYFEEVDQKTLLAILEGIFKMTGTDSAKFVSEHTLDLTSGVMGLESDTKKATKNLDVTAGFMDATSINTAMQKACGQNKNAFALAIMHSAVATNLENLNLFSYLKYTDANGIQRDLTLGTLNGRLVIVTDEGLYDDSEKYTTYLLGKGSFSYEDIGAKVPYEMSRDPKTNGGQTTLYARQRKCFAPMGISYTKSSQVSLSPTDAELKNGANWKIIGDDDANSETIDHKMIPIARIISKG